MKWLLSLLPSDWSPWILVGFICAAGGFGAAWEVRGWEVESSDARFDAYKSETDANAARAELEKLQTETRWKEEVQHAQDEAEKRLAQNRADMDALAADSKRLRKQLAAVQSRLARAPEDACLNTAATLGELLGDCQDRYSALGEKAQRHAEDIRTLSEAWPK
jgi:uncharacterized protein (DUF3084 family)